MIVEARKRCSGCGEEKPLSGFYRDNSNASGVQSLCKACNLRSQKRHRIRHGRGVVHRADKYGLTVGEVKLILNIPACQACGMEFVNSYAMKFDHCHAAGHFRGVLCHRCNMACVGKSQEAIPRLRACIDYLQRDLERVGEQG